MSIVDTSDNWLERIKKRESRVRLASAFLALVLVFVGVGIVLLSYIVVRHGMEYLAKIFQVNPDSAYAVIGVAGLSGLAASAVTYFLLRRKHELELKEISSLISKMKRIESDEQPGTSNSRQEPTGYSITGDAISLADKIVTLLPQLARKRDGDSLLFGIVALILALLLTGNLGAAVVVGVAVWLYFRYETRKSYDQEITKFEEQRRILDQRKQDFLETL